MRRRLLSATVFAMLLCTSAQAGPIGVSVKATVLAALTSSGISPGSAIGLATIQAIQAEIEADAAAAAAGNANPFSWWGTIRNWLQPGQSIGGFGGGGGGYGGGGASDQGGWDAPDYCSFDFRLDADGGLIVPATMPPVGTAMTVGSAPNNLKPGPQYTHGTNYGLSNSILASSTGAVATWAAHNENQRSGSTQAYWAGLQKVTAAGSYFFYRPASYTASGAKITRKLVLLSATQTAFYFGPADYQGARKSNSCPDTATGGGNFHFYGHGTGQSADGFVGCTWYAPNSGLGLGGYALSSITVWPNNEIKNFPTDAPEQLRNCKLSPALIKAIVDRAWRKAAQKPGYEGAPPPDNFDPKTGGQDPKVDDLKDDPREPLPEVVNPTDPWTADPNTPPSGGTTIINPPPSYEDAPASSAPQLDTPDWKWWPELPTISVPTSSTCPTYSFEAFERTFTLNSHCQLVEDNRALISVLMVVLFSFAALRVALSA